jgi:hypothetical protein
MLLKAFAAATMLVATAPLNAAVIGDFRLDGSLANQAGGALTLTNNGANLGATGLTFGVDQGPTISGFSSPSDFSIEFRFTLDKVVGYNKLVDFLDRSADAGVYALDGKLSFYPCCSSAHVFLANQAATLVLTRNSAGSLLGYVDGTQILQMDNAGQTALASNLHFFRDDFQTSGEVSSGFVDYIRIYDTALSASEVAALTPPGAVPVVPEPATWAMMIAGFGLAGAAARRRRPAHALA